MLSLPVSLIALSFAATKAFYLQRLGRDSDPSPSLFKNVLLVLPLFLVVTFSYEVAWAFVLAYVRVFVFVPLALVLVMNVMVFKAFRLEVGLVLFKHSGRFVAEGNAATARSEDKAVEEEFKSFVDGEIADLKWNAIFTSVLTPCVVGQHRTNMLLVSAFSTTLALVACLLSLPLALNYQSIRMEDEPPISHCFQGPFEGVHADNSTTLFCHFDAQNKYAQDTFTP